MLIKYQNYTNRSFRDCLSIVSFRSSVLPVFRKRTDDIRTVAQNGKTFLVQLESKFFCAFQRLIIVKADEKKSSKKKKKDNGDGGDAIPEVAEEAAAPPPAPAAEPAPPPAEAPVKTPSKRKSGRDSKKAMKASSNIFDCFEKSEIEEFKAVSKALCEFLLENVVNFVKKKYV